MSEHNDSIILKETILGKGRRRTRRRRSLATASPSWHLERARTLKSIGVTDDSNDETPLPYSFGTLNATTEARTRNAKSLVLISGLFGYSTILTAPLIATIVALGSSGLTFWEPPISNDEELMTAHGKFFVPQVNERRYWTFGPVTIAFISFILMAYFIQSGYDHKLLEHLKVGDYSGPPYAKVAIVVFSCTFALALAFFHMLISYNVWTFDSVLTLLIAFAAVGAGLVADDLARAWYGKKYRGILSTAVDEDDGNAEKSKKSFVQTFRVVLQHLTALSMFFLYPVFLVPVYIKSSDLYRLCFVCIIHPLLIEILMANVRMNRVRGYMNVVEKMDDVEATSYITQLMQGSFLSEYMQVSIRRFLLSAMRNPSSTTIGIILTGIEEVFLRCTLVERDTLYKSAS